MTGCQKVIDFDDERKLRIFYEKRMGAEVEADALGEEWKVLSLLSTNCHIFLIKKITY